MSVCFYNNHGIMGGMDVHTYITVGPKGIPVPVKAVHLVGTLTAGPSADRSKRTYTVHADGVPMIELGFANSPVPHVPLTALPPHPTEALNLLVIHAASSSKTVMGVASVTGEGTALATCVSGFLGANSNCGPGVGEVLNPCSVITSPSATDYAMAAVDFTFNAAVSILLDLGLPKIDHPLVKAYVKKAVTEVIKAAAGR